MNPMAGLLIRVPASAGTRAVEAEVKALRLLVQPQAADALLAADPAVLEPAERRGDRQLLVSVDPYRARVEPACHAPRAAIVRGPDAGGESVRRIVGLPHQVLL